MMADPAFSETKVLGPEDGESYWQPVPANGFIRNLFSDKSVVSKTGFAMGTQTVAPGCFVREHTHDGNEEIIFVVSGRGIAKLDGSELPIEPGSCVFIARNHKHQFINPGPEPITWVWYLMPGGLQDFFAEIGRARIPGEPAPEPFPRPANVDEIEARTVFGWTDKDYAKNKPEVISEPAE
jgi:quercetin dioxygenase-like cupin family protein